MELTATGPDRAVSPVAVTLYYQSLCPGSRVFISQQLFPTWSMLQDIMTVTLVPYGNTEVPTTFQRTPEKYGPGKCECLPLAGGSVSKLSLRLSGWGARVPGEHDRGYRRLSFQKNECKKHGSRGLIDAVLQACIVHLTGPSSLQTIYCMESAADPLAAARPVSVRNTRQEPVGSKILTSLSCCLSVSSCTLPPSPGPPLIPV